MSRHLEREAFAAVTRWAGITNGLAVAMQRVQALEAACDIAREELVRDMRGDGWTWAEIGEALGVTQQAAHGRFRARGIV